MGMSPSVANLVIIIGRDDEAGWGSTRTTRRGAAARRSLWWSSIGPRLFPRSTGVRAWRHLAIDAVVLRSSAPPSGTAARSRAGSGVRGAFSRRLCRHQTPDGPLWCATGVHIVDTLRPPSMRGLSRAMAPVLDVPGRHQRVAGCCRPSSALDDKNLRPHLTPGGGDGDGRS